ncbi:DeoR family transcriptional regulator [Mechercharimyces sp. CAU 1602]|nr:DeoR family transcriptional regulator [Mechercharimyces sp. CAU 1602]
MLPEERQRRIREWVLDQGDVKISDLSAKLHVSEMTIHRDLKPLLAEGIVKKTYGGVMSTVKEVQHSAAPHQCVYCQRQCNPRLACRIIRLNGNVEIACCGHCGFLQLQRVKDVDQLLVQDFLLNTTFSAKHGWFVMESSFNVHCCQPQLLPFEQQEVAEKFVKGFGGLVLSYKEALDVLIEKMNHATCFSKRTTDGEGE